MSESKHAATKHVLRRTSAKGEEFTGVCVLCGAENLSIRAANERCPNPLAQTFEQAWGIAVGDKRNYA